MRVSEIKNLLKNYHQAINSDISSRISEFFSENGQIKLLKSFIAKKKDEEEVLFSDFLNYAISCTQYFFSEDYLNRGSLDANLFKEWSQKDAAIKFLSINAEKLALTTNFVLPLFSLKFKNEFRLEDIKIPPERFELGPKKTFDLSEVAKKTLTSMTVAESFKFNFFNVEKPKEKKKKWLKESSDYHPETLRLLGENMIKCAGAYIMMSSLRKKQYDELLTALGAILINRLLNGSIDIPPEIIATLKSFIEINESSGISCGTQSQDSMVVDADELKQYIMGILGPNSMFPFVILHRVSELVDPTLDVQDVHIENCMKYLCSQLECKGGEKFVIDLVNKFNAADDILKSRTATLST